MISEIKAGAYKTDITPPLGIAMVGTFDDRRAEQIVDHLYSNAIVIDDGKKEAAIVSVDVCIIPDDIFKDIVNRIESACGIDKRNIIIAATHTHAGPLLENIFIGVGEADLKYVERFKKSIIKSVTMAKKRKQVVTVGIGKGKNDKFVFNRRLKKPDGTIIMNFAGKDNLQDCTSDNLLDPDVIFIVLEDMQKKPFAFIVNYANHNNATNESKEISADFSGYLSKTLAKVYGKDVITLFLPGACGDINWIDYNDYSQGFGIELAEKIGISLAGTVLENLYKTEYLPVDEINIKHTILNIPDRAFSDNDIKEDITFGTVDGAKAIFDHYKKEKEFAEGKELPVNEIDVHVICIGNDIAIVTNPGELFTRFGLEIKNKSPFKYTLISELTNGYAGYVCTPEALKAGGYEAKKTNKSSHLEAEAGEKIVDASLGMLNEIIR